MLRKLEDAGDNNSERYMNTHGNKINPKSKQNEIILILMRISMQAQPSESTKNCVMKTAERGD
jgi:hypothetical protein